MATLKKVDVVTVGAGLTASIMAQKLTKQGYTVVSLEQGPARYAAPDFEHDHDPLRYHVRHAMMQNLGKESWTWRPNPKAPSLPMRHYGSFNPGQGIGGSAIHWSAQWWRFFESDFQYRTHHVQRYGEKKLPEGSTIQDWPVTYQELEPYYDQAEYDIGVSGTTGNLMGQILPGGNPFEGPRTRMFPLPALHATTPSYMFADASTALGYHPFPQPAAITSQAYTDVFGNFHSGCLYCGFCTRYGCEVDAKISPVNTYIPAALATGRYEIRTNAKVIGINVGADGLATGLKYIDENGVEQDQPADVVLVTGYTLTNVRLLLLSRSAKHPNGVGNDQGRVGKNYTYQHWHSVSSGVFPGRHFKLYTGNTTTMRVIHDFDGDNFDHKDLDFIGGAMIFGNVGENDPQTSVGNLPISHASYEGSSISWGSKWKEALRSTWDSYSFVEMEGESLPYVDQYLDLDPTYKGADGLPLLRLTFDWHQNDYAMYKYIAGICDQIMTKMGPKEKKTKDKLDPYEIHTYQSTHCTGGAIMGSSPKDSVTNKYGQVWDTPNVFVTGAALYPQNPGMNPTGTLWALAYMTGDALVNHYMKGSPNQLLA